MLLKYRYDLLIFLLLLAGQGLFAQKATVAPQIKDRLFTQPDDPDAFLSKTVLQLLQDSRGFVWVGSTDGLGRYDGRKVDIFKNSPEDTTSLSNNYINDLLEDRDGKIWIATKRGLNCYDPAQDRFKHYLQGSVQNEADNFVAKNYILCLAADDHGNIWFGTYGGLFKLDLASGEIEDLAVTSGIALGHIYDLYFDDSGRLWISNWEGLIIWKDGQRLDFEIEEISPEHAINKIAAFNQVDGGAVWAATDNGFLRLRLIADKLEASNYLIDPDYKRGANSNDLRHIFAEPDKLWLASINNGLVEVRLNSAEEVTDIFITPTKTNSKDGLRGTPANFTMKDASGNYWIATSTGVDQINVSTGKFGQIKAMPNNPAGLSGEIVTSLYFDSRENLWVGTITGLNFITKERLERRDFSFEKFNFDPADKNSISNDRIYTIEEDSFGRLWLGTRNGLSMLDLEKFYKGQGTLGKGVDFQNFNTSDGLPSNSIYDIREIRKGQFWIATNGKLARMRFDPVLDPKPVFLHYDMSDQRPDALVNALTYAVEKDTAGAYWVATFLGLSRWSGSGKVENDWQGLSHSQAENQSITPAQVGSFENFRMDEQRPGSISDNSIVSLLNTPDGTFWVGTRNGLNRWNGKSFDHFGLQAGFENTLIQSMEVDLNGKLWIGTNDGLVNFDPAIADAFIQGKTQPPVLRTFLKADGITGNGFVFRASTRAPDGTLYFGTASGITYFKGASLSENTQPPQVAFTGLKILNSEISPGKKPLDQHIDFTERFTLNHRQNDFSISFASLEFTRPSENSFQYKLEGFDPDWISTDETSVGYTNLDPGRYKLMVKALNNDGVLSEDIASVGIRVLPPPWKSTAAYIGYALLAGLLIFSWQRALLKRRQEKLAQQIAVERARMEEREELRRRSAADFHDELGHRITKISLFTEMAARQGAKPEEGLLQKIQQNVAQLSDGVRDLIWNLDPSQDTLFETLSRLQDFGNRLFEYSEIVFIMESIPESAQGRMLDAEQRKHLLLIFKEAMNNSLKYSEANRAQLVAAIESNSLEIVFEDNGIGLDANASTNSKAKNHTEGGRGLKNMRERAQKINAEVNFDKGNNGGVAIRLKMDLPQMG